MLEGLHAGIDGTIAQFFLNAQQLVVLGHAFRTGRSARLDLVGVQRHSQIGNGGIFRLAAAMGYNRRITCLMRHLDGFKRFGQRTNLIQLNQDGIAAAALDAFLQTLGIGDEQIIPHELYLIAQLARYFSTKDFQWAMSSAEVNSLPDLGCL